MIADETRKKLQNIVRGTLLAGSGDHFTTIRNLLCQSFGTSATVKSEFESKSIIKENETRFLSTYAKSIGFWMDSLPYGCDYLTRGGEAEVYLAPDKFNVIKVNDAIYYATWTEYFNSLVIHNLLFPNTAYSFLGFKENKGGLCLILQQAFVEGSQASLKDIEELLTFNGFANIVRQDYYNNEFGLLLEDMHDENVIVMQDVLFFIDTVFYNIGNKYA